MPQGIIASKVNINSPFTAIFDGEGISIDKLISDPAFSTIAFGNHIYIALGNDTKGLARWNPEIEELIPLLPNVAVYHGAVVYGKLLIATDSGLMASDDGLVFSPVDNQSNNLSYATPSLGSSRITSPPRIVGNDADGWYLVAE